MHHNAPLANEFTTVCRSHSPEDFFCFSPGLTICPSGRLIATFNFGGPGVAELKAIEEENPEKKYNPGRIFVSDDHGKSWKQTGEYDLFQARPFVVGNRLYILGQIGDLGIISSEDWGETWSEMSMLTVGEMWQQAPSNVWYANDKVYLVMEKHAPDFDTEHWCPYWLAPVVMSARVDSDLTLKGSWIVSNDLYFKDAFNENNQVGVPFWPILNLKEAKNGDPRYMAPPGWLETQIVEFKDRYNVWHDPLGKTFYLWMRAHTGSVNMACIAKVVEADNGQLTVCSVRTPGDAEMLYIPCPGGQMKFHILFDEKDKMFWLLSTQTTDSMTHPTKLPADRYNLPNNERQRLVLHFSKNCVDWCFAGFVATGPSQGQPRNYASMVIDGDDIHLLSRSGDSDSRSAHNSNLITFHTIKNFRDLVY